MPGCMPLCEIVCKGANGTKFKDITDPLEILEKALASITDVERNGAPDKVKHSHLKCDFGSETEITCRCGSKLCNAGSTMDSAIRLVILLIAASLVGQQAIGICGRL
jgi:hypothetical protein